MENSGLTPTNLNKMNARYNESISHVAKLQQMETDLYTSLDKGVSQNEKADSLKKIKQLSEMRNNLLLNMKDNFLFLQNNVSDSRNYLVNDLTNIGVAEQELNNTKKELESMEQEKTEKMRKIQMNTYYTEKYTAYIHIMKMVIYLCIPLVIIGLLDKFHFIPNYMLNYLIGINFGIIAVYVFIGCWDIYSRDDMNFNEYNISTDDNPPLKNTNNDAKLAKQKTAPTCVGNQCCTQGMVYDITKQKCQSVLEGMSGRLPESTEMSDDLVVLETDTTDLNIVKPFDEKNNQYTTI